MAEKLIEKVAEKPKKRDQELIKEICQKEKLANVLMQIIYNNIIYPEIKDTIKKEDEKKEDEKKKIEGEERKLEEEEGELGKEKERLKEKERELEERRKILKAKKKEFKEEDSNTTYNDAMHITIKNDSQQNLNSNQKKNGVD